MLNTGEKKTSVYQSYCVFALSLQKKNSIKKQGIASTEISLKFLAPKVPAFRKNKAAISSASSYPFFSFNEKPCTCRHIGMGSLRYIPTSLNCADDATQGRQAKVLASEHRWCSRPESFHLKPHTPIVMN